MTAQQLSPRLTGDSPLSGIPIVYRFIDHDVSNLNALALHFEVIGRLSLVDDACHLALRVHSALMTHGVCHRHLFRPADFARLMSWAKYAREVSPALQSAIRDLAERIWCGLTGDETCPIKIVEEVS
jgi:hypothetical protein